MIHNRMKKINNQIILYLSLIALIIISSLLPEAISGHSPFAVDLSGCTPPGKDHIFGTDFLGRDILSRTLIGGRISIIIGLFARLGSILLGLSVGLLIGLSNKNFRYILNSIVEVFLSIPALLLAMGLAVVLGEGQLTIVIAIVVGTWAPVARFISTRVVEIQARDYVFSARAVGIGRMREIYFYIIPALMPILLPLLTTGIATSIMMESTLSFLGLGGGSSLGDVPSWGLMIQEGSRFIFDARWMIIPPSIFLMILILSFNRIGDLLSSE